MSNKQNNTILHVILIISDLFGAGISLLCAFFIRYGITGGISMFCQQVWVLAIILTVALIVDTVMSPVNGFLSRGMFAEFTDVLKRQLIIVIAAIAIIYMAHIADELSRLVTMYYALLGLLVIWILRIIVKWYLVNVRGNSDHASQILIVTTAGRAESLTTELSENKDFDKKICGTCTVDEHSYDDMIEYITRNKVDEVFIALPDEDGSEGYKRFISELLDMRIKVDLDIIQFEMDVPGHKGLDQLGSRAVVSIVINTMTISKRVVKRCFDILGGIVGCVICFIVSLFLVPIILIDSPGHAIFVQKRVGKNGRIFDFYKFRSMYVDAEARKQELMKSNSMDGLMFKIEDDPRITKVGKFIRKTSLDEFPQFFNVLKGDMSLVGTRPPTVDEYSRYEYWQKARLAMKPGITGLWQVSGRSEIKSFDEVVKLDMQYIDNWSFGLDVKILLKTIAVVFTGKGSM